MKVKFIFMSILLGWCLISIPVAARQTVYVPEEMAQWKEWVLFGQEKYFCPSFYDQAGTGLCLWPDLLELDFVATGGNFLQKWTVLTETWIPLPGSTTYWPQRITINSNPAVAVPRDGIPCIHVFKGSYMISGEFNWDRLPQTFPIPPIAGFVSLKVNGRKNKTPFIDSHSNVWIQKRNSPQEAPTGPEIKNLAEVRIFRLIEDTVPLKVHNLIRLKISGEKRREKLTSALLKQSLALSISSPLPAKLSKNDDLWVEVKPGQWDIHILTVINAPVSSLGPAITPYGDEIWLFKPYPHLRMVTVEGLAPIDPTQTNMPGHWKQYSSFLVKKGDLFHMKETQRGSPETVPDTLNLQREVWLDFNGIGATVRDQISGHLGQRRFLGINGDEYALGRLILNGKDQLVTSYKNNQAGIELEKGPVHLTAISRLSQVKSGERFSIGWGAAFDAAGGKLHLPPGWSLLGVQGGRVPENATWVDRWSLLDFFIILIITFSVAKLWNFRRGGVFFIGLVMIWQELYSPQFVWLSLVLTTALLRLVKDQEDTGHHRFRLIGLKIWHLSALVILAGCVLVFSFVQLRSAIYPQLEPHGALRPLSFTARVMDAETAGQPSMRRAASQFMTAPLRESKKTVEEDKAKQKYTLYPDQEMITQTGPGIPAWEWKTVSMSFDRVSGTDTLAIWLVSPVKNRILSAVRVAFLLVLVFCFINSRVFSRLFKSIKQGKWIGTLSVFLIFCALFCYSPRAWAGFPSQDMLNELGKRLLAPHECFPACATIPNLGIQMPAVGEKDADTQFIDISFEVNAAREVAVPLPSGNGSWSPFTLKLDGESYRSVIRKDNHLWMRIPEGSHMVRLRGMMHEQNQLEVVFPLTPYYVRIDAKGWNVSGLDANHQVSNVLKVTRKILKEKKQDSFFGDTSSDLSDFFQVRRTILLGLEWAVVTTIDRLVKAENQQAAAVSIPLIQGELVRSENLDIKNGFVHLEFPPGVNRLMWKSSLPITPSVELMVPEEAGWAEVWHLEASPLWHYTIDGLPATYLDRSTGTFWYPWPGEKMKINLTALKAAPGQSLTIDSVRVDYHIGKGYNTIELSARIRTSRGGQHPIMSPENTILKSVTINGVSFPVTGTSKQFMVPLKPGTQTIEVEWQQVVQWETGWVFSIIKPFVMQLPEIDLQHNSSNIDIFFHLPDKVWLLLTGGPRLGPAVLIWSYILIILLSAVLLGKYGQSNLRIGQWVLLGLGLVILEPVSIVLVAAWFLAIGMWKKGSPRSPFLFNLMQICLVAWSLFVAFCFYRAVQNGLLGIPDMQVAGNGSTHEILHWTQDRSDHILPRPWIGACSLYAYRAAMFLWALWFASNAVSWTKWVVQAFREKGMWKRKGVPG